MAILKETYENKIQLGSLLVLVGMAISGIVYVANDHNNITQTSINQAEIKQQNAVIIEKVDGVLMALPVVQKTIEINGSRISQLEAQYREVQEQIAVLQQFEATTEQTLAELKQNYSAIVAVSQGEAPVKRAHQR